MAPPCSEPNFPIHIMPDLRTRARVLAKANRLPDPATVIANLPAVQSLVFAALESPKSVDELAVQMDMTRGYVHGALYYLKRKSLVETITLTNDAGGNRYAWRRCA